MTEKMKDLLPLTIKINHYAQHEICRIVTTTKMHYRINDTSFAEFLVTAANNHHGLVEAYAELLYLRGLVDNIGSHSYWEESEEVRENFRTLAKATGTGLGIHG